MGTNSREVAVRLKGVKKMYKLGQIGGGTLRADLQSWWAKKCGKDDPNTIIGQEQRLVGKTFMALNGIDLDIYQGEALGIIGSNGAGKSTLLKLLSRVTAPTEGDIDIYGRIASMLEVGTGFNPEMTGRENIFMNGAILGMTKEEINDKMEDIIEFSEVRDFIDTPVKRYSSGMYVKLAFSVAAHLDSEIMIMDEVLAVGDMAFQKKCLKKMKEAANQGGRTVLYVSHNMSTIRQLCDRCIVLDKGKVIFEGAVEEAISIYSGVDVSCSATYYDLSEANRPYGQHGKDIRIESFSFTKKEKPVFERIEPLEFQLKYHANKSIDGLKIYFTIKDANNLAVGTTQTFEAIRNAIAGNDYSDRFKLDVSNLAVGQYSFTLDIFSEDGQGSHLSYDHPLQSIVFEIVDSHSKGIMWQKQYFGSIILNGIEIQEG